MTCKGRVVFEGSFVSEQSSHVAVFEELALLASLMAASKMADLSGWQKDWAIQQSDTQQADAQIELKGPEP